LLLVFELWPELGQENPRQFQRLLLDAFGKQPRHAWLDRDGVEVQVLAETLQKGDVIVVHTGDTVPSTVT